MRAVTYMNSIRDDTNLLMLLSSKIKTKRWRLDSTIKVHMEKKKRSLWIINDDDIILKNDGEIRTSRNEVRKGKVHRKIRWRR